MRLHSLEEGLTCTGKKRTEMCLRKNWRRRAEKPGELYPALVCLRFRSRRELNRKLVYFFKALRINYA